MQHARENAPYLPGVPLPEQLTLTSSLSQALTDVSLVILAVPSHAMRALVKDIAPLLHPNALLVSAAKGIEEDSFVTMSDVIAETCGPHVASRIAVLSGPSFAAEVARDCPTAVTLAARDKNVAATLQQAFSSRRFRVYTTTDVIGVEVGGAVKNVIALAAGVSDGLGYGHSARAALITRGLAEMKRFAVRLGGEAETLSGLSGMGDLILTCTSRLSRNYSVGTRLAQGERLEKILHSMAMVAEGVRTSRSVWTLAKRLSIEMPIVEQVHALLYESKPPDTVLADLLAREMKSEFP
jgi:glycerol-3-phosphate dehydrogenase (NAD(P)+)